MQYTIQKNMSQQNSSNPPKQITLCLTQYPKNLVQTLVNYLYTGLMEKSIVQKNEFELLDLLLYEYDLMPHCTSLVTTMSANSPERQEPETKQMAEVFENTQTGNSELTKEIKQEIDAENTEVDADCFKGKKEDPGNTNDYLDDGVQVKDEASIDINPHAAIDDDRNDKNRGDDDSSHVTDGFNLDNDAQVHDDEILDTSKGDDLDHNRIDHKDRYNDVIMKLWVKSCAKSNDVIPCEKKDNDEKVLVGTGFKTEQSDVQDINDVNKAENSVDVHDDRSMNQDNEDWSATICIPNMDSVEGAKLSVDRPKGVIVNKKEYQKKIDSRTCSYCNTIFDSHKKLIKHMREEQKELAKKLEKPKKVLRCEICGKLFQYEWTLASHLQMHTRQPIVTCRLCNKSYHRFYINTHMRVHATSK